MSNIKNNIIVNLPKDLGDCLICIPAIRAIISHAKEQEIGLIFTGNARSHDWVQTLSGLQFPLTDVAAVKIEPAMTINLNFYDHAIADTFPSAAYYALAKMEVVEQDRADFGAGAVVGKEYVSELLEDCLRDAGILKKSQHLFTPSLPKEFTSAQAIKDARAAFDIKGDYAVLIPVCAANRPMKKWQDDKFAAIAKDLLAKGVTPVLVGGPADNEKQLCADINAQTGGKCVDVCGKTDLAQIAALAKGAQFTLGNDTGPSHIAAAAGGKTFVLFGYYNDANTWAPHGGTVIRGDKIQNIALETVKSALPAQTQQKKNILGFNKRA